MCGAAAAVSDSDSVCMVCSYGTLSWRFAACPRLLLVLHGKQGPSPGVWDGWDGEGRAVHVRSSGCCEAGVAVRFSAVSGLRSNTCWVPSS